MEKASLEKIPAAEPEGAAKSDSSTASPRFSDAPTAMSPMRKRRLFLVGAAATILALGVLGYELHMAFTHESTDDAFIDAHVSAISARVEGQVTKVLVDDNQLVKQGDVLAEIDPPKYEVKSDQARAQLKAAEARARRADLDLARYESLVQTDDVTRQQLDVAKAEADSAHAEVLLRQAQVRETELDRSYTQVVAPEAGRVTHKSVTVGDYLKVGQPILALVPNQAWVTANFKETQLTHMKSGQFAKVEVDAYPGHVFTGHVDSIQSGTGAQFSLMPPENATGNYVKVVQRIPVKIVLDDVDAAHPLVPGMSANPTVTVK